jgi:hypothetical protein
MDGLGGSCSCRGGADRLVAMIISGIYRFYSFLNGDPVRTGPQSFVDAIGAIISFADLNGLSDSLLFRPDSLSEELVRERLKAALEKASPKVLKSRLLPSMLDDIRLDGYKWILGVTVTGIPHLEGLVLRRIAHSDPDGPPAHGSSLVRHMVDSGRADLGATGEKELYGKRWELYTYLKIRLISKLGDAFEMRSFSGETLLPSPRVFFPTLNDSLSELLTVRNEPSDIRAFLDRCDRVLLERYGRKALDDYLFKARVSSKRFLGAQA